MAPYVFEVHISNDVHSTCPLNFAGSHTRDDLDGSHSVAEGAEGSKTWARISKSGGTDGLFTVLSFWLGTSDKDVKLQFEVYCEMAASAGSEPAARLGDCNQLSWDLFNQKGRAERYENKRDNGDLITDSHLGAAVDKAVGDLVNSGLDALDKKGIHIPHNNTPSTKHLRIPIGDTIVHNGIKVSLVLSFGLFFVFLI